MSGERKPADCELECFEIQMHFATSRNPHGGKYKWLGGCLDQFLPGTRLLRRCTTSPSSLRLLRDWCTLFASRCAFSSRTLARVLCQMNVMKDYFGSLNRQGDVKKKGSESGF